MSVIFSRACEYALRGLLEMARRPEKSSWTIPEVAEATDTPAPFLAKTFQLLVKEGVLNSTKGRTGGFSLARPAKQIFLIEIVNIIDGSALTTTCVLGLPECNDANPCPFHVHWKKSRTPLVEALSRQSLAQMTRQKST
jgi:Rrf2 family protein